MRRKAPSVFNDFVVVSGRKVVGNEQLEGEGALITERLEVVDQLGDIGDSFCEAGAAPAPGCIAGRALAAGLGKAVADVAVGDVGAEQLKPHAGIFNADFDHVLYVVDGADVVGVEVAQSSSVREAVTERVPV